MRAVVITMPNASCWRVLVAVGCAVVGLTAVREAKADEPAAVPAAPPVEVASTESAPEVSAPAPLTFIGAPAAPSRTEQDKPQSKNEGSVYTRDGLLGPVRVGPSVGAGAPDGMRFSLFATYKGLITGGAAVSVVPTIALGTDDAKVGRRTTEAFVRVHPFRGAFFLGVAGGVATTNGSASGLAVANVEASRVDLTAKTSVGFVAPHLGARWMLPFGMTAGLDVGVEIPVSPGTPELTASNNGQNVDKVPGKAKVESALRFASHTVIPTLHLIELGYAF